MTGFGTDPLADVRHEEGPHPRLVLVREFRHRPDVVWRALVEPAQLAEWSPYTAGRALDALGPVTFAMIDGSDRASFAGHVQVVEPPRVLEYTMDGQTVRWELEPAGDGTRLTLRQTVTAPDWLPRVAAGWHICLAVAQRLLDGHPIGAITGSDARRHGWAELHDRYAAELGVPAAS